MGNFVFVYYDAIFILRTWGYTKLSYMTLRGFSDFIWGPKDIHRTLKEDILLMPITGSGEIYFSDGCGLFFITDFNFDFWKIFLLNFLTKLLQLFSRVNFVSKSSFKIIEYFYYFLSWKLCYGLFTMARNIQWF